VLSLLLELAVRDGRMSRNPAAKVSLPKPRRSEPVFLTGDQVGDLAGACRDGGLVVLVLAYTGLRFGELASLRMEDIDVMRRRIRVHRAGTEVGGRWVESDTTKTHAARTVPFPRFLADRITEQLAGREAEDYAFSSPTGGPLRIGNWRARVFDPACKGAGISGVTPHDLRHTAASLAVSAGANVKAVQRMLGHASAAMTLDVYAALFDADLEAVADRLDSVAPQMRPKATVTDLAERAN
jgi:integrase